MQVSNKFTLLSDKEWIEHLTIIPPEEEYHNYFFSVKCAPLLRYIAESLFDITDPKQLIGEFYELLSKENWKILNNFKGLNGASLNSYLSRCAVRHFVEQKRKDSGRILLAIDTPDIVEELNHFTQEEESEMPPVWQAFERLSERERIVLRCMVIDGMSALEAAKYVWPHVKTKMGDWQELPVKRVQDTIAMLKRRALLALTLKLKRL
ncbi:MAG: sigma-70 family RNA polymerase sigma factor [Bacteroidaceae bacterium]|nr:sigma-70 family RNA polymerase sigma factor [Bacteroidaceae bacterium]